MHAILVMHLFLVAMHWLLGAQNHLLQIRFFAVCGGFAGLCQAVAFAVGATWGWIRPNESHGP